MKKITEVEQPVVGRQYRVPCVIRYTGGKMSFWPVIGPWHEDKDIIGFDWHHFHYDVRFLSKAQMNTLSPFRSEAYALVSVFTNETGIRGARDTEQPVLHWKRRLLKREMPDFPSTSSVDGSKNKLSTNIEAAFKDVKMTCMTCPHRGFKLTGLPVKDGNVVCNGHGLKWNLSTGEMVPR